MRLAFWRERTPSRLPSTAAVSDIRPSVSGTVALTDEDAMICAAKAGNRAAFDALCAPHLPLLRGFIARRTSGDAVDDIVQETLLGAWMRIGHFEPNARFKTWLFQIALHKTIDANRARERKGRHEQTETSTGETNSMSHAAFGQPGDRLEAEERRKAVLAALEKIPAGQREVVLLYFYAEMTLPEIAQATGRNLSTVKYQFYAAHAKIAGLLKGTPWAVGQTTDEIPLRSAHVSVSAACSDFAPTGRKVRAEA